MGKIGMYIYLGTSIVKTLDVPLQVCEGTLRSVLVYAHTFRSILVSAQPQTSTTLNIVHELDTCMYQP